MKSPSDWVQALQIAEKDIRRWQAEVPQSNSLAFWCLEQGKIPQPQYTAWAREHYELPSVASDFFANEDCHLLWRQIKSVANWSKQMIPLTQWDGVIFIGCVEPVTEVKWSFPVQFVLADAQDLARLWEELNSEGASHLSEVPAQSDIDVKAQKESKENEYPPEVAGINSDLDALDANAPEGFELLESIEGDGAPAGIEANFEASSIQMPEGFPTSFNFEVPPAESVNEGNDVSSGLEAKDTSKDFQQPPAIPEGFTDDFTDESDVLNNVDNEHSLEASSTPPPMVEDNIPNIELPKIEEAKASNQPFAQNPVNALKPCPIPENLDIAVTEDEVAGWAFAELSALYERSLILYSKGDCLEIWKSDGKWELNSDSALSPVSTKPPSVFRIVARTGLPFHGPVSASEVNVEFFKKFNLGLPEHLTVCPIKSGSDSQVVAMLVSMGTEAANTLDTLAKAQEIGDAVTSALGAVSKKVA